MVEVLCVHASSSVLRETFQSRIASVIVGCTLSDEESNKEEQHRRLGALAEGHYDQCCKVDEADVPHRAPEKKRQIPWE